MKPLIFIPEPIHDAGMRMIEASCDWDDRSVQTCDAMIVRLFEVTKDVIASATKLRVIGKHGVGIDNIDRAAASARGIPIVFTPEANFVAVAEHTVALMLALARNIGAARDGMRDGAYPKASSLQGIELEGKTIGIIGLGRIGSRVARIAREGLGMRVVGFDVATGDGSIAEVLTKADVLTLHVPLTDGTHHLLDDAALRRTKPGVRILNTSRGPVIDEAALARALDSGHVAGAALDVFETEPLSPTSALRDRSNVLLTPHVSSSTAETLARTSEHVATAVVDALAGTRPRWLANPEVLKEDERA